MSISDNRIDPNRVFEIIEEWMRAEGRFVDFIEHPQILKGMQIMVGDQTRGTIIIPVGNQNLIQLATNVNVSPIHQEALASLDNVDFETFWFDLLKTIISVGADFGAQKKGKIVSQISAILSIVMEELYISEQTVSKRVLYEKLDVLRRAGIFIIHIVNYYSGTYSKFLALPGEEDDLLDDTSGLDDSTV